MSGWNIGHTASLGMSLVGITLFLLVSKVPSPENVDVRYQRRMADPNRSEESKARLKKIAARRARRCHA